MSVKIVYQDMAVGAAEDAAVSATYAEAKSNVNLLPFGGDKGLYATLEPSLWTLDGTIDIYNNQGVSYVTSVVSTAIGSFPLAPEITITFDNTYTSLGIFISQVGRAYCDKLKIRWYNGSTLLADETFRPTSLDYFCEKTVENYNKVIISLLGMTNAFRRARIDKILFGIVREFGRDELRAGSANLIQQIDNTGRDLPYNTLDWTLSSKKDVEYIFQQKQLMTAYDGDTLLGAFYIDDSNRLALRHYSISCKDAIGVLDDDAFPDAVYTNKNALQLAQEICGSFAVDMQSNLQSKTVTGILLGQTRRQALQQLCFAINAVADTSGSEAIRIFTLDNNNAATLDEHRIRPNGSIEKSSAVTAVTVTAHSYSTSGSGESVIINGTTYYDTQTTHTIVNAEVSASEKANIVEVSDATLVSPSNLIEVTQHLFNEVVKRNKHKFAFRLNGELVGRYLETLTPWEAPFEGFYIRGNIKLSGFALSDAEVIGE